jgi:alpha-tubulin suppressor-like RCC1 family protein
MLLAASAAHTAAVAEDGKLYAWGTAQGLKLVHFLAQLERFLLDRGCA